MKNKNILAFFISIGLVLSAANSKADLVLDPSDLKSKKNLKKDLQKKVDTLTSQNKKEERSWFGFVTNPTNLQIKIYKQAIDKNPAATYEIKSAYFIKKLVEKINRIPKEGDMMVSFAPTVPVTYLTFTDDNQKKTEIEIYARGFKTPSTGFNSQQTQDEKSAINLIHSLSDVDYDKKITLIEDLEYKFKDFSVVYVTEKKSEPAPVSVSFTTRTFNIKSAKSKMMTAVEVTAGQMSPPDTEFTIDGKTYVLKTHDAKDAEEFYPSYFKVLKK